MNNPLYGDEYRKLFGNMTTLFPSAQDAPDMTVKISAGGFWSYLGGVAAYVDYVGGRSPAISAPISNAKWVVVTLNPSGMVVNIDGDYSSSPVLPIIPVNRYPIALVYVNSTDTKLTNAQIFDARPIFSNSVRSHLDLADTTVDGCHETSAITGLDALLATLVTITDLNAGLIDKADVGGTTSTTFTLNEDATGTTTADGEIIIERGSATNVAIRWYETTDNWQYTNDGAVWYNLFGAYYNDGSQDLVLKQTTITTTPPSLADGSARIWIDSGASNKVYLIFKPTGFTQVKVQLS